MGAGGERTEAIMREIASLRAKRDELDSRIRFFEAQLRVGGASPPSTLPPSLSTKLDAMGVHAAAASGGLSPDMVRRYSRQLLLPEFGVQGQRRLSRSSVLVVGAGGLGSAVALYLAACGVGSLGIADGENIMHVEAYVGQPKVKSASAACRAINSSIKVFDHHLKLKSKNAVSIVRQYDIVVDATNSIASRYMLSDCCALLHKPLISGSTIGLKGQLTVYNHNGGPCYRCLFPNPAACQSSSDNGILGVVPGVIGCLQALEVIKVATRVGEPLSGRMLHFDALSSRFKTANKIHQKSSTCTVCGSNPNFTQDDFMMFDYDSFAQSTKSSNKPTPSLNPLPKNARVTCREYKRLLDSGRAHLLLDVRPVHHFQIASIANSVNIPLHELKEKLTRLRDALSEVADVSHGKHRPLYFISQRGDDSQVAVHILRENGFPYASDIVGGLESWAQEADPGFPVYW
ncbi:Adenylyltransferase and sulfurtransferase MOCS3 [Dichanthelium oligosanthes]|uniref:Adenylyltransferase and sulfurtransferase MOCS3 n=1 Tax=Dichanthelium oligosanthes TaxID=888268 RepID=A0A1E5VND3_9POAL|nr:Adenylyltransferase and sulfurtransferase MOCS3 [Dichanthelium oligosanthes]